MLLAAFLLHAAPAAAALKAIDVNNDSERLDIFLLGEFHAPSDQITIDTVPDTDGVSQSWTANASTPGTKPGWFAFALRNTSDSAQATYFCVGGAGGYVGRDGVTPD